MTLNSSEQREKALLQLRLNNIDKELKTLTNGSQTKEVTLRMSILLEKRQLAETQLLVLTQKEMEH